MSDGFFYEAMDRAMRYGLPYTIIREAFQTTDGDRCADECANQLAAYVDAALWGAKNARDVLSYRQVEETEEMGDE